ncbi:hypothetical protein [Sulfuricurvum sp.]|uniref:nucleotide-binding protein n=1 Tax=Sulfuricurvum sp. TaxID=2025608 RepID=UPI002609EB02|nr:hypothetical protein [Sulfuricurvum sp.]MDD2267698.1 hypothetical protein [Sulfuricurvum sp.]MDD2949174.1 hypothetical protein [Sulfuricurvum sp.]
MLYDYKFTLKPLYVTPSEFVSNCNNLKSKNDFLTNVIAIVSTKGGTGKSTIASILHSYFEDDLSNVVLLNLDIKQFAYNNDNFSIVNYLDYMDTHTIREMIVELSINYNFVIIDTPSNNISQLFDILSIVQNLIIPISVGNRSLLCIESMIDTLFGEGSTLSGFYNILFMFNNYINCNILNKSIQKLIIHQSDFFPISKIKLNSIITSIESMNIIYESENLNKSIFQVFNKNKSSYSYEIIVLIEFCKMVDEYFYSTKLHTHLK